MNIGKYFRRKSCLAHLLPALQSLANLMQETPFYLKLKFSVERFKKIR